MDLYSLPTVILWAISLILIYYYVILEFRHVLSD